MIKIVEHFFIYNLGIMMVLAWMLLVVIGIVTARYNKDMLPGEKLFGTKVLFQVRKLLGNQGLVSCFTRNQLLPEIRPSD